jgi:selenocysteine lyase/cysteine desulfurase
MTGRCELEATGLPAVGERVRQLTGVLRAGLRERGYPVAGQDGHGAESPIVSFTHPAGRSRQVYDHLTAAGCVLSYPDGTLRLAPHFWTTDDEIAVFLESLPAADNVGP